MDWFAEVLIASIFQGSYGNGAAMRISPTALFGYQKNLDELNVR